MSRPSTQHSGPILLLPTSQNATFDYFPLRTESDSVYQQSAMSLLLLPGFNTLFSVCLACVFPSRLQDLLAPCSPVLQRQAETAHSYHCWVTAVGEVRNWGATLTPLFSFPTFNKASSLNFVGLQWMDSLHLHSFNTQIGRHLAIKVSLPEVKQMSTVVALPINPVLFR